MKFFCVALLVAIAVAYVVATPTPAELDPVAIEAKAQGGLAVEGKDSKIQKRGLYGWGYPGFYGGWGYGYPGYAYGWGPGFGWGGYGGYGWGGYFY